MALDFKQVQNVVVRPLLGIKPDTPTQGIPEGGFVNLNHFYPTEKGIKHFEQEMLVQSDVTLDIPHPPVMEFFTYWTTDGVSNTMLLDSKFLYIYNYEEGLTRKTFEVSNSLSLITTPITASSSGSTVTFSESPNTYGLLMFAGDVFEFGGEEFEIQTVSSNIITLDGTPTTPLVDETTWVIHMAFFSGYSLEIAETWEPADWVVADDKLIIVDGRHFGVAYDVNGDSFEIWCQYAAKTIEYARDRIYIGNIQSSTTNYDRQAIRWSEVGSGQLNNFPEENYTALPYTNGEIVKLKRYGDYLLVFFDDSLWYGTPTNYPSNPYWFRQMESGGKGLGGKKAVCSGQDQLYFIGQDNIYIFSNTGISSIGNMELENDIRNCALPYKLTALYSTTHTLAFFLFPNSGRQYEKVWVYNPRIKEWGKLDLSCEFIGETVLTNAYTFADFTASGALTSEWADIPSRFLLTESQWNKTLFFGRDNDLYYFPLDYAGNGSGEGIIQTPDYDLDSPDKEKTIQQFSLKLSKATEEEISLRIEASNNYGHTWKTFGIVTIPIGMSEGKVNGKITGAIIRFRLTQINENENYIITEFGFRVKERGREMRYV